MNINKLKDLIGFLISNSLINVKEIIKQKAKTSANPIEAFLSGNIDEEIKHDDEATNINPIFLLQKIIKFSLECA